MPALLRYIWAFPNTIIGVLFVAIVIATKGRMQVVDGVLELSGPTLASMLARVPIRGGAAAMTFGHIVIGCDDGSLAATRGHERVHVRQCELWGPAFIPAYLLAALWAALSGRGAYRGNSFEREAYAGAQRDACTRPGGWETTTVRKIHTRS
jgi:hypothetical protein